MKTIGSQKREKFEDTDYVIHTWRNGAGHIVLMDKTTGKKEKWILNDNYAGYVIEINGKGYEFVSS